MDATVELKRKEMMDRILNLVCAYSLIVHDAESIFISGETYIPPSKKLVGRHEIVNLVEAALEGWLTEGHWVDEFEREFADWLGVRCASMVNSGSSANLLAVAALRSPMLSERFRFFVGSGQNEIITAAAGFPTTLNPILQYGFEPVLIDVNVGTYVPAERMILEAMNSNTAAIMLAHTLGNPVPYTSALLEECERRGIAIIEDNCDALGSVWNGKKTGTLGLLATHSFYPAHHMTTGEGGMIATRHPLLKQIVESLRDWGRDCWCEPGLENTCGKRFEWEFDGLPANYDHKYVYSSIGYNLKSTDLQAAVGVAQVKRLDAFAERRAENFKRLHDGLSQMNAEKYMFLPEVSHPELAVPSWFGFPLTVKEDAPFTRDELVRYLNESKIGTRNLFGGNLKRQPAYRKTMFTQVGGLAQSDLIAEGTFWIGVHPGIGQKECNYMVERLGAFVKRF